MARKSFMLLGLAMCLSLAACGGPKSQMIGKFAGPNGASLEVTSDKMNFVAPMISISFTYKVVKEDGNNLTLEISPIGEGAGQKVTITLSVDKSGMTIQGTNLFDGRWTKA